VENSYSAVNGTDGYGTCILVCATSADARSVLHRHGATWLGFPDRLGHKRRQRSRPSWSQTRVRSCPVSRFEQQCWMGSKSMGVHRCAGGRAAWL